ncbi:hypothetical protein FV242_26670 [Methylobacterium sp. WL64]|uniref:hypothetical protein n=1 Tax=Methylobacterium sp. WL64 TaxID=2603894 RepID=UPI0011CA5ED0|nr:hypothetical protein [Methylobacterium sp. WL64]TXM99093.1 hypothetical protein FV242_26670 [Methylobacterium sp. WL64]
MNEAFERMRSNPVAFTKNISGAIGKAERGAHRQRHQAVALCAGIAREVRENFSMFEELREASCLRDNKKVQKATEDNFKKYVPFVVAACSFVGTEATENRIRVYGYATSYFVRKKISVPDIADKIAEMDGIDGVYKRMKAAKRKLRELLAEDEANTSGRLDEEDTEENEAENGEELDDQDNDQDESDDDDQDDDELEEAPSPRGTRPKARAKSLTVKYILANCLLVWMPGKKLDPYRNGPFSDDEHRGLKIVYGGKGPKGLKKWEFVSELELEDSDAPDEDNDNAADDEEEDAA